MNGKIRVAVIGAGMIANKAHIPAYLNIKDRVEIVGVSDYIESNARDTAARFGIPKWFTDAGEMLSELGPDLVSVCSPNAYHKPFTELAIRSGCNVICEKPMALTYADTKALFDLAKANGKHLFACQTSRYNNAFMATKEFAESGVFGNFYYGELDMVRRRGVPKWGTFHLKEANGGGAFCDLGVHAVDSMLWIMGNPAFESISGFSAACIAQSEENILTSLAESGAPAGVNSARPYKPSEFGVEEFASGSMRFSGGISINFKIAWAVNLPPSFGLSFAGDKAGIRLPEMEMYSTMGRYQVDIKPRVFNEGPLASVDFSGHYFLVENIAGFLNGENEPIVKPEETLNVAAVIDAFYVSAAEKREVRAGEIIK